MLPKVDARLSLCGMGADYSVEYCGRFLGGTGGTYGLDSSLAVDRWMDGALVRSACLVGTEG